MTDAWTLLHHCAIDCFSSDRFIGYAPCSYVGTRNQDNCASDATAYGDTAEEISPLSSKTAAVSLHCLDKERCE